jgi:hypothetical protein
MSDNNRLSTHCSLSLHELSTRVNKERLNKDVVIAISQVLSSSIRKSQGNTMLQRESNLKLERYLFWGDPSMFLRSRLGPFKYNLYKVDKFYKNKIK